MTGTELLVLTRYLIEERVESKHLDTEISIVLNAAFEKWTSKIIQSNWNYYIKSTTATVSATTRTATLPSDCTGKVFLIDTPDSDPILEMDFAEFKATDDGNPRRAAIIGPNTIYFKSIPGSDYVVTLYYYYVPTAISVTGSTEIDFPKGHHALLAYEAAVAARLRDESTSLPEMLRERMELQQALQNEIDSRRIDGTLPAQSRSGQEINMSNTT